MEPEPKITGKLDTNTDREEEARTQIRRALKHLKKGGYLCTYADDQAGDLALKFENGDALQTIVIEVGSWPEVIFQRILQELKI